MTRKWRLRDIESLVQDRWSVSGRVGTWMLIFWFRPHPHFWMTSWLSEKTRGWSLVRSEWQAFFICLLLKYPQTMELSTEFSEGKCDSKEWLPSLGGWANIKPEDPIEVEFTRLFSTEAESHSFRSRVFGTKDTKMDSLELKTKLPNKKCSQPWSGNDLRGWDNRDSVGERWGGWMMTTGRTTTLWSVAWFLF